MITNIGKSIIAKYMIGQAPAYASYMAFGCGATPLKTTDTQGDYSAKKSLDFEMFRVPIISRGHITEDGVQKIVLTAELPTEERYEISEVGIFSAGSNPSASMNDSRTILSFGTNEIWEYHTETSSVALKTYVAPLNISTSDISMIDTTDAAFQTNANNPTLSTAQRVTRRERPRFLNNTVLISGSTADLTNIIKINNLVASGTDIIVTTEVAHSLSIGDKISITEVDPVNYNVSNVTVTEVSTTTFKFASIETGAYVSGGFVTLPRPTVLSGSHIHLTNTGLNFNKNSPFDELKLAMSVINKDGLSTNSPDRVSVIVEFSSDDSSSTGESAKFDLTLGNGAMAPENGTYDFDENRYIVISKQLQQLPKTSSFNWANVQVIKIYASILDSSTITNKQLISNVATLTTAEAHGFAVGSRVTVSGVDATFNGIYVITAVTPTTFSYELTAADVSSVTSGGSAQSATSNYYTSLDAMRLENISTYNPLYGLTGYTVVQNTAGLPVLKDLNTSNLSEFRFGLNVTGVL